MLARQPDRERIREHARMGHQANEAEDDDPRQTDRAFTVQLGLPPRLSPLVYRRFRVVGVNEKVDVRKNHA